MTDPYFDQDGITIYHADCRYIIPMLGQVDMVLTDPPYSEVTHAGARTNLGHHGQTRELRIGELLEFEYIEFTDLHNIFGLIGEKARAWVVSFMDWRHITEMEKAPPVGLNFVRFGVWVKPNSAPQFTGDRPSTGWEGICFLHKDGKRMAWNGSGRSSVFTYPIVHQNNKIGINPTEKPIPLLEELIGLFSKEADMILDPFMGSGATLQAARLLGRRSIGIEIDERQCEVAARFFSQRPMFMP